MIGGMKMNIDIPVQRWHQAISNRHSQRKYLNQILPKKEIEELHEFVEKLNKGVTGVRAVFKKEAPDDIFQGIIGSYGKISGAPSYVAFLGEEKVENTNEKIGYLGEAFILEATSRDLGTCWIGGFFDENKAREDLNIKNSEKIYALSPVGFPDKSFSLSNKLLKAVVRSHKRKPLDKLCKKRYNENIEQWKRSALKSARLAPSAINRQPWRFELGNDSIKVYKDNNKSKTDISKNLDCGIAMLHLEVGAKFAGVKGRWSFLEQDPYVAEFRAL